MIFIINITILSLYPDVKYTLALFLLASLESVLFIFT